MKGGLVLLGFLELIWCTESGNGVATPMKTQIV